MPFEVRNSSFGDGIIALQPAICSSSWHVSKSGTVFMLPMQVHREPLYRRYYAPYMSGACLYAVMFSFLLIFLPLILAYNSSCKSTMIARLQYLQFPLRIVNYADKAILLHCNDDDCCWVMLWRQWHQTKIRISQRYSYWPVAFWLKETVYFEQPQVQYRYFAMVQLLGTK